jgi:uncharacterized protein
MKIKVFAICLFLCFFSLGTFFIYKNNSEKKVCFGNNCFIAELAKTEKKISQGLMFRENLATNRGMLFVFSQSGVYSFWMKNTKIPLDIIWFNDKKEIVFLANNVVPCYEEFCPSINPGEKAKYVLEINADLAEKLELKIGDKADF